MENKYVLYSAEWCPNCGPMKMWLETQEVQFDVIDIDNPPEDIETPLELRALPSLCLDGKVVAVGDMIRNHVEMLND